MMLCFWGGENARLSFSLHRRTLERVEQRLVRGQSLLRDHVTHQHLKDDATDTGTVSHPGLVYTRQSTRDRLQGSHPPPSTHHQRLVRQLLGPLPELLHLCYSTERMEHAQFY